MKDTNFLNNFEKKEHPPLSRVEIYIVRHGKQEEYTDQHSILSPEGEKQAEDFAQQLLVDYLDQDVVIKIKRSPEPRAYKTGEIIAETLAREIEKRGIKNIKVLATRESGDLKTTGALGPLMEQGVDYAQAVDEWLNNADRYEGSKSPQKVLDQLGSVVSVSNKLSQKVSTTGPKIVYVMVTHETAHAALMNELTGKNTEELGGRIGHLEPIKINVSGDPKVDSVLSFRNQDYSLDLSKLKTDEKK